MSEQQTPRNDDVGPERPRRLPSQSEDMAKAQARIAQLDDGWRRAAAELDNFRKRCAKDLVRAREQERARTAAGWLPVVDNWNALWSMPPPTRNRSSRAYARVHRQALSVLAGLGFPRRDDTGSAFDPALHEAIGTIADGELRPGTVARVVRPGYGLDAEILRPAAVVVATGSD